MVKNYILPERFKLIDENECRGCQLLDTVNYVPMCKYLKEQVVFWFTNENGNMHSHYKRKENCPLVEILDRWPSDEDVV